MVFAGCVGDPVTTQPSADAGKDTNTAQDGATDGSPSDSASESAAPTACSTNFPTALFCEDFDVGAPKAGWTTTGDPGQISTALAFSKPNGFRFATPQVSVATSSEIVRQVTGGTSEWTLSARVHVDVTSGANANVSPPIVLQLEMGSTTWSAAVDPINEFAHCGGIGASLTTNRTFATASWHQVALTLAQSGGNIVGTCTIDGAPASSTAAGTLAAPAKIHAGIRVFGGQGPFSVSVDDIVFAAK